MSMTTEATNMYLDQLIERGYGADRNKVRDYLISRTLDDLIRANVITTLHDIYKRYDV